MRSAALFVLLGLCAAPTPLAAGAGERILRVCADPNNLPFSNARHEGFEDRIAELLARELGAELQFTFWPQRRGFVRSTLGAGRCDAIMGVPAGYERALTTAAYYRSTYVFVERATPTRALRSFDDPRLRRMRVGVPLVGDDYANPPPVFLLSRRGIADNVRGYSVLGDYARPSPPSALIEAVDRGEIDVAIAWGPLAGYFARRSSHPLRITPVHPQREAGQTLVFPIAVGVRRDAPELRDAIDRALRVRRSELQAILREYGVPKG